MDSTLSPLPGKAAAHKRRLVADNLRTMIAGLRSGDRLPSLSELEKHFGVGKSTVEAAVNELESEGLVVRRQGAGTFVADGAPRGTARTRTGRIMLTSIPLGQSLNIFSALAAAVETEMRRMGYETLLHCETSASLRLARAQERWESGSVDGFIHVGSLTELAFPPVPGVIIGEVPEGARVHQVSVDNYGGGRLAGEYLCEMGHRRVAMLSGRDLVPAPARFQGLADVFRERGGRAEDVRFVTVQNVSHAVLQGVEAALRSLMEGEDAPTALFFANDQVAFPALQILLEWGYRIPRDLSVLSFDDTPGLASHTRPALTSLRIPTLALGALAVQTLHQVIHESSPSFRRLLLPAELITRESSGPPPGTAA